MKWRSLDLDSSDDRFFLCFDVSCTEETVARRRSAALLSEFGLGHVRKYAPFGLILSALHLILRAKSQINLVIDAVF